jgi:hypothetical protein
VTEHATEQRSDQRVSRRRLVGLGLGPLVFLVLLLAPPPPELGPAGWRTVAVASLMAVWWITEAIPIPATALLPWSCSRCWASAHRADGVALRQPGHLPVPGRVPDRPGHAALGAAPPDRAPGHPRRGHQPVRLIGGFMLAAAFLSMWVSNTATAVMMLPIGLSVIDLVIRRVRPCATAGDSQLRDRADAGDRLRVQHRRAGDAHRHAAERAAGRFMAETYDVPSASASGCCWGCRWWRSGSR